jgi:hypothetical protein
VRRHRYRQAAGREEQEQQGEEGRQGDEGEEEALRDIKILMDSDAHQQENANVWPHTCACVHVHALCVGHVHAYMYMRYVSVPWER